MAGSDEVVCEVVGFNGARMLLMPLSDLEGISPGARVYAQSTGDDGQTSRLLPIGNELLGRVLDAQGTPSMERVPWKPKLEHH
ncbi:Flagellum-specific ATP synthase [Providencia rustigianii]|nr:Flagellum-specific ATP synthase [Providencia rustigianii]